ncbi:MAG: hypothetical protein O6947_09010 [Acidobacteria bacterium]|nr:hypothetical protein [Acidobacteriota bacterium]
MNREEYRERIRLAFARISVDEQFLRRARGREALLGMFIQELNLGWGVRISGGQLTWIDKFPHETRDRCYFRQGTDFHRYASGTPRIWLAFRRRLRQVGSAGEFRLLHRPLVRAYTRLIKSGN